MRGNGKVNIIIGRKAPCIKIKWEKPGYENEICFLFLKSNVCS